MRGSCSTPAEASTRDRSDGTLPMMVGLLLAVAIAAPPAKGDARSVLRRSGCQTCHDSALSVEHTDALEQFDLKDPKWSDGMTDRQLPILLQRMGDRPKADLAVVRSFIDTELRTRRQKKAGRPEMERPAGTSSKRGD